MKTVKRNPIYIAICDDEKTVCSELERLLLNISFQLNIVVQIDSWYSGEGICQYLDMGNHIDIIFLDIELMRLSGIDVGHHIRDDLEDRETQIVYISSKKNYALQLFDTQPFDFLVKPVMESKLLFIMKRLIPVVLTEKRFFEYQTGRELCRLPFKDILYFKSEGHKVIIVLMHQEIEYYGKLKNIIEDVPTQFLRIHKSYLINRDFITRYTYSFIEMRNGQNLTISRVYQKEVRRKISNLGKGRIE